MTWRTDSDPRDIALQLGGKFIEMLTKAGGWVPNHGGMGRAGNPRNIVTDGVIFDAELFMALDPQKITDEYFRLQRAARATGEDSEALAELEVAGSRLATWHGTAATEFAKQMSFIQKFMEQQEDRLLLAVKAMGMTWQLTVDMRHSYYDLAEAAFAACELEMEQQTTRDAKAALGMGAEAVKAGINMFTGNIKDLAKAGIDAFVSMTSKGAEIALEGSEAGQVIDNYHRARDQLRRSWEDGLWAIRDWVNNQEAELSRDDMPLLEPMDPCVNVDSPDFSYDKFSSHYQPPASFGPKVTEERKKMTVEHVPSGVIAERLGGAG